MFEKNVTLNRCEQSLPARRRQSHVSISMLGGCFTTPGLFLKRRLQGCGIETSKAATRQQTPCNIATNQLPSFCDFACCATPLLKQPSRVPGCLIICRATSRALPSFISVAVGYAADMRVSGPQQQVVNGRRLQRLRALFYSTPPCW